MRRRYVITLEGWKALEKFWFALTELAAKEQLDVEDSKTRWHVFNESRRYAREQQARMMGLRTL